MGCHAPIESIAEGKMKDKIRQLGKRHGDPAGCVVCHGGDPAAKDREMAHRGAPETLTEAGGPAGFHPDPGELWVADRTCEQCHEGYAIRVRKSVKSTRAESIGRNLCAPAWRERARRGSDPKLFGRYAVEDQDGPEPVAGSAQYKRLMGSAVENSPELYPSQLHSLPEDPGAGVAGELPHSCQRCHGDGEPRDPGPGCSACHIPYRADGTYQGKDPTIDRTRPGKLLMHRIQGSGTTRVSLPGKPAQVWRGMPLENCFQCHFDPRDTEISVLGSIHAHYAGHRHEIGGRLLCQDCHTSIEMHGDGNIAATNDAQREIDCQDCHGTTDRFPWELPLGTAGIGPPEKPEGGVRGLAQEPLDLVGKRYPAKDGYLVTSRGNPFGNVVKDGEDVWLYSASGSVHQVTLLKRQAAHNTWRSELGRQVKSGTAAHRSMACTDCHAEWAPPCYGCHEKAEGTGTGSSP
jgi:hypothetical protein